MHLGIGMCDQTSELTGTVPYIKLLARILGKEEKQTGDGNTV